MLLPDAQLREHEGAADERGGLDAQDAVAEVREGEAIDAERGAFAVAETTLRADGEHGRFRRR